MMKILINGESHDVKPGTSLGELVASFGFHANAVAVERNELIVRRSDLAETQLQENDKIEIVHLVGGGSPSPRKTKSSKSKSSKSKDVPNLVIVESPAKAKTINKYLGPEYQVEASMGHIRDLPKSKMGIDPANNFSPNYVIISKARKTVTHLKKMAVNKARIYLAPDPDREGEAISWHLAHIFNETNGTATIRRVFFNEITKEAVQDAFRHPRDIQMSLVNAQQARRILDRIVGYELSPLLWRKVGSGLSAGRVQSVALRLIVEREREIKSFVPQEYWSIEAKLSSQRKEYTERVFLSKLEKIGGEKIQLKSREQTEAIRQEILSLPFKVEKVDKTERRRRATAPYTTSKLQQEAYNKLGFPAVKTMRVAQKLYEGVELGEEGSVGLITYMRTDAVNVAKSAQDEAAQFIAKKYGKDYLPESPPIYRSRKGAQEAHEAVRPTSVNREPALVKNYLAEEEFKLYELIWKKFVASQMMPAIDEHVAVSILAGDKYYFKTTGRRNLFAGFTIVYGNVFEVEARSAKESVNGDSKEEEEEETSDELPELLAGELLTLHELMGYQHFTKPPARFNDASLVKLLEENGIGRPSTYAPILYTLLAREYVNRKGGALSPTELGEIVVDLLIKHFPKIMDVGFTAEMEDELDKVEDGDLDWQKVLKDFYTPFQEYLNAAREEMKNVRRETTPTDYVCDLCGKQMVMRWGRFGKFLACSGFPECKHTRSIPTGFRCPNPGCGGDLVKRMSKKRRVFYGCSKYPNCTYITNKLPKEHESLSEDDKISDMDRETLGP